MSSKPSAEFLRDAVYLVDSSSYIFRAYYAIMSGLKAPDGTPTHATFGFLQMIQSLVQGRDVARCVLVWDRKERGFRYDIFPEYKANRSEAPEDMSLQIENAREASKLLGFPQSDAAGFEADDVLATIVETHPNTNFVIVTADKDLLQLVGPKVWCLDTLKEKWSNIDEAREKFGVGPELIPQVQAICGDSVDNIPGIRGIGPKGASELIDIFGNLDALIAEAKRRWADPELRDSKKIKDALKGKKLEAVATQEKEARVSLELVSLRRDVPLGDIDSKFGRLAPDAPGFQAWATRLGMGRIGEKLLAASHARAAASVVANQKPEKKESSSASFDDVFGVPEGEAADVVPHQNALKFKTTRIDDVEALKRAFAKGMSSPVMSLDTETFGLDVMKAGNVVGFSFAFGAEEGFYVPLRHRDAEKDPKPYFEVLRAELHRRAGDGTSLVFQNGKFDLHAFKGEGVDMPASLRIDDTMLASFVIDPAASHGMDALALRLLEYQTMSFDDVLKGEDDFSGVDPERATFYAAEDAVVTWLLWGKLAEALRVKPQLWQVYDKLDRPLMPILFAMEREGVCLDAERLHEISKSFHIELADKQRAAIATLAASGVNVSPDFNLMSPKQIGQVLFEELKLPVIKKTKTGPSTDVSVLEELADKHPFPKALLEIREISKLLSTYVDAFPKLVKASTGKLHTDFSQTIAQTGRLSSSNPNLQNIPIRTERGRRIRDAFTAGKGMRLIGVDYSQVELRVLASMSNDEALLKAFRDDADIHTRTAALIFEKSEKEIDGDERRAAKTINFGIVYGQSAFGLAKTLGIPRGEAQKFIDAYFKSYPGIRTYMDEAIDEVKTTGAVRTLTGRPRPLPDIKSANQNLRSLAERMAINSPIQGTAADLMKAGMIRVFDRLRREVPEARLVLQVHDELLLEAPEAKAEQVRKLVVDTLEDPSLLADLGVEPFKVKMKADSAVGLHWGEL